MGHPSYRLENRKYIESHFVRAELNPNQVGVTMQLVCHHPTAPTHFHITQEADFRYATLIQPN